MHFALLAHELAQSLLQRCLFLLQCRQLIEDVGFLANHSLQRVKSSARSGLNKVLDVLFRVIPSRK